MATTPSILSVGTENGASGLTKIQVLAVFDLGSGEWLRRPSLLWLQLQHTSCAEKTQRPRLLLREG